MTRKVLVTSAMIFCFAVMPAAFSVSAHARLPQQKGGNTPAAGSKGYSRPTCKYCPVPEYSEQARKLKIQGQVVLDVVVGADGRVHNIKVVRGVGYGLDEKALETVRDKWTFVPANGPDGKPAAVHMLIDVDFHLY
jgi:TonB family protein